MGVGLGSSKAGVPAGRELSGRVQSQQGHMTPCSTAAAGARSRLLPTSGFLEQEQEVASTV